MRSVHPFVLAGCLLLAAAIPVQAQTQPQPAPQCQFVLGFKTLHDLDASDVGDCIEAQSSADNGDAQQHTTSGLLAWRKADNWTAFTNGYRTWINGPAGLVARLNTQRYPWEADYNSPGITKILPPLAPNGLSWTVAFDHNLVLPGISVDDGSGHLKPLQPKGRWINFYFRVRNNQSRAVMLTSDNVSLSDKQGRSYVSAFDLRQLDSTGTEVPLSAPIQAGATATARLTLDIPADATGGVLHVTSGNDVAAL